MATQEYGPAFKFWLEVRRQADRLAISVRTLADRSGVSATSINRLKTSPHRGRAERMLIVRKLAATLNEMSQEQFPASLIPFPDDGQVLELAGLNDPEPDETVSVRDSIRRSAEYDEQQKSALLGLLDVFDRERTRSSDLGQTG